jgi:trimeric autotransporter adhesin
MLRCSSSTLSIPLLFPVPRCGLAACIAFLSYVFAFSRGSAAAADVIVTIDPENGRDVPGCNMTLPCQTIEYALHSQLATVVLLASGTFTESGIRIRSSVRISGMHGVSIIDCNRSGPGLIATNVTLSISGVTFQNCLNVNVSSSGGGAVCADGSTVEVSSCKFFNNTAATGGAIAVTSGTLLIASSLFENNTATCLNASIACSSWGGAVSSVAAASVTLVNNTFNSNAVRVVSSSATAGSSSGGGCVSIMYPDAVSNSEVFIDNNTFLSCLLLCMVLPNISQSGITSLQHGNTYGGAVSLYYAFRVSPLTVVSNALSSFTNNRCLDCSILASGGMAGNVYGGCLSVYTGAWNANSDVSASNVSLVVDRMLAKVRGNDFSNCSAIATRGSVAIGSNVYGGAVSFVVGFFHYSQGGSLFGDTAVSSSSYTVSNNTLTNCIALSSTSNFSSSSSSSSSSNGTNVYGGGISIVLGAYHYSRSNSASFSGNTAVTNSSFTVSNNTLTNCSASAHTSSYIVSYFYDFVAASISNGSNVYGGGISLAIGAYSYSGSGNKFNGNTDITRSTFTVSNNALTNCSASAFTSSSASRFPCVSTSSSSGMTTYGGGVSLVFGSYFFSGSTGEYTGNTSVSSSSYSISNNTLTNCTASSSTSGSSTVYSSLSSYSDGAAAYGGGIVLITGSYLYSQGTNHYVGDTLVNRVAYFIAGNSLTNCTASATIFTFSASSSSASGAISYGGGICVLVGAYHYKKDRALFDGDAVVSSSSYIISNNTLTNCSALSSTSARGTLASLSLSNGANAYGGGIVAAVGSYHYSKDSSTVRESTSVVSSSYDIAGNTLTNCFVSSATASESTSFDLWDAAFSASSSSKGANVYGGGMAVLLGSCHFIVGSSLYTGYATISNSSYTISNNTLTNCSASSTTSGSSFNSSILSKGGSAYGGALSHVVGSYVYSLAVNFDSDSIVASNSNYTIAGNAIDSCSVSSSTSSSSSPFSSFSDGTNTHGGGVSLLLGSYHYSTSDIKFSGSLLVSSFSILLSDLLFLNCRGGAFTSGVSSETVSFGGALSVAFGYTVHPNRVSNATRASTTSSALEISRCNFTRCASSSCSPGASSAAGGAVFLSVLTANTTIVYSSIRDSYVSSACTASLSQTFSLGGGISVNQAGNVVINSTNISQCVARGNRQAINVFVSGGGVFVQSSASVTLENSFVGSSGVEDAFSARVVACGGGAIGTMNVSIVRLSNSKLHNNSDSSLSGVALLQQLDLESGMVVNITNESALTTNPAINDALPALNISCGLNCTSGQQMQLHLHFQNSALLAQTLNGQISQTAILMSLPRWTRVSAAKSSMQCDFSNPRSMAVLARNSADRTVLSCSPCDKPLFIAVT